MSVPATGASRQAAAEAYPPALPLWDKLGAQKAAKRRCPIQKEDGGRQAGKELISDARLALLADEASAVALLRPE